MSQHPGRGIPSGSAGGIKYINSDEVMLLHSELKKINVKDFHKEVRAEMDIDDFFKVHSFTLFLT